MGLQTLKPRLSTLKANRTQVLEAKAGTTERIRGYAGAKLRRQALVAGVYTCVDCGVVRADNEIDHEVPLEQGGSNELSNLKVRCKSCHKAKTVAEATARSRKY